MYFHTMYYCFCKKKARKRKSPKVREKPYYNVRTTLSKSGVFASLIFFSWINFRKKKIYTFLKKYQNAYNIHTYILLEEIN